MEKLSNLNIFENLSVNPLYIIESVIVLYMNVIWLVLVIKILIFSVLFWLCNFVANMQFPSVHMQNGNTGVRGLTRGLATLS